MNKRIIISLSVIGAVAAIAVGGTIAYFSDVETSTGNTFTAGSLDLILVDVQAAGDVPVDGPLFVLEDMKPGDKGEKTLKLWVVDNPACGFVDIDVISDLDNTCTEPELEVDIDCSNDDGELNDEVKFLVWKDPDCNNILNGNETPLVSGPITAVTGYGLGGLDINPICYGIAYCFGTWNMLDGTCNGLSVDNASQSDSFSADLTIRAEQYRHQFDATGAWPAGCLVGLRQN